MYEKILVDIRANPKMSLLAETKGKKALDGIKHILFGRDTEAAEEWAKQFSAKDIQSSHLLVVSRLKRTQKEILVQFVTGSAKTGSVTGQKMTYPKGMKFIHDFF